MKIDDSFFRNRTIHRTILQTADDPRNSIVSCGFLCKRGGEDTRNICFSYYGGIIVLSGSAVYTDAESGKEYPVSPGWMLQRMPGVRHHTRINPEEPWLEFYFCAGSRVFETLADMHLVSREPVFYVGQEQEIFERILNYHDLFEKTDDADAVRLLMAFQEHLCWMNARRDGREDRERMAAVKQAMQRNLRVGVPLQQIAAECGIGYESLRKEFPRVFGCSMSRYMIQLRINEAKTMLLDRGMTIKETAQELGYCDTFAFANQFKSVEGMPPGKFVGQWKK